MSGLIVLVDRALRTRQRLGAPSEACAGNRGLQALSPTRTPTPLGHLSEAACAACYGAAPQTCRCRGSGPHCRPSARPAASHTGRLALGLSRFSAEDHVFTDSRSRRWYGRGLARAGLRWLRDSLSERHHTYGAGLSAQDVVFSYLRSPSGLASHLHLSWFDPHKEAASRWRVPRRWRLRRYGARADAHRFRQGLDQ